MILRQKSTYRHNYSHTNEQVLHFVNTAVLFSLSDICLEYQIIFDNELFSYISFTLSIEQMCTLLAREGYEEGVRQAYIGQHI